MKSLPFFKRVNWDPDAEELRKFALAMFIGFAIIGLLGALRTHQIGTPSKALWAMGVVLAIAAYIPGLGRSAYLAVYVPSTVLGYVISHVLLTIIFLAVFTPLGLFLRLLGKDLLLTRRKVNTAWETHTHSTERSSYYRQF